MLIRFWICSKNGILKLSPGCRIRRYFPNMVMTSIYPWLTVTNPLKIKIRMGNTHQNAIRFSICIVLSYPADQVQVGECTIFCRLEPQNCLRRLCFIFGNMGEILDILIIGAGPIGLACGLEAKKAGLRYLILEKGVLVNSLYHYPSNMTFFSTSERIEIGDIPFVSNNVKPTRPEALEYYRRIAVSQKLNIHLHETVQEVRPHGENYKVKTSVAEYTCRNIVVATGFYDISNLLHIPGEDF